MSGEALAAAEETTMETKRLKETKLLKVTKPLKEIK
jgi:hypothetical protein